MCTPTKLKGASPVASVRTLDRFTRLPTRFAAVRSPGDTAKPCECVACALLVRCLCVADVCLPETEIRAENWQAARCCADRSEVTRGAPPTRPHSLLSTHHMFFAPKKSPLIGRSYASGCVVQRGSVRDVAWIVAVEGMWRAANVGCRYRPQTGMRKMRFVWRGSQRNKPTPPRMKRVGWMGTLSCIAGDPHCTNVSAFDSSVVKADHPISDCTGRHGNRGKRLTNVGSRAIAFRAAGHDNSYRDSFVRHVGK